MNNSEDRYSEFFNQTCTDYTLACQAAGGMIHMFYQIGNFKIRLCFAGGALIPIITQAFEHLAIRGQHEADLTVYLWDTCSTGIRCRDLPWDRTDHFLPGEIWDYFNDGLMILSQPANNTISMLDIEKNVALWWIGDAARVPYCDRASPLRMILRRWGSRRGIQLAHSAAIGYHSGGVLLAGRGGSGKSTTALACLKAGLLYAGDDHCLLSLNPGPFVHSLYNSGKLDAADVGKFIGLDEALSSGDQTDGEKALFFFFKTFPGLTVPGFPLSAILLPHVTGEKRTLVKEVSPARGLLAIAPSSVFQLKEEEKKEANLVLGSFVRQVPNYLLELGTELSEIPEVVARLCN
jgi:hypothetical protein